MVAIDRTPHIVNIEKPDMNGFRGFTCAAELHAYDDPKLFPGPAFSKADVGKTVCIKVELAAEKADAVAQASAAADAKKNAERLKKVWEEAAAAAKAASAQADEAAAAAAETEEAAAAAAAEKAAAADKAAAAAAAKAASAEKAAQPSVTVDGEARHVEWGDANVRDCTGKIQSVDESMKGAVRLEGGHFFFGDFSGGAPTANADGLDRTGRAAVGSRASRVFRYVQVDAGRRRSPSAFAVGMRRDIETGTALGSRVGSASRIPTTSS